MVQDQFDKIRQYLLDNGQQELVGHLDGFKKEYDELHNAQYPNRDAEADAAEAEAQTPNDPVTAQDFQDDAKQADETGATPNSKS